MSDPDGILATPVETVRRERSGKHLRRLVALVAESGSCRGRCRIAAHVGRSGRFLGAGMPSTSPMRWPSRSLPVPVRLADERLTTVSAQRSLREAGVRAKQQRGSSTRPRRCRFCRAGSISGATCCRRRRRTMPEDSRPEDSRSDRRAQARSHRRAEREQRMRDRRKRNRRNAIGVGVVVALIAAIVAVFVGGSSSAGLTSSPETARRTSSFRSTTVTRPPPSARRWSTTRSSRRSRGSSTPPQQRCDIGHPAGLLQGPDRGSRGFGCGAFG